MLHPYHKHIFILGIWTLNSNTVEYILAELMILLHRSNIKDMSILASNCYTPDI